MPYGAVPYSGVVRRIDSPKNPLIKTLARLKERRQRERERRYLIEGQREVQRALEAHIPLTHLLHAPEIAPDVAAEIAAADTALAEEVEELELSRAAFERLSLRQRPDGLIAVAKMQERSLADLTLPSGALALVIDGVEKPGNVGALLRTADAGQLDAVLLTGAGTDLYNPNVIRASVGSVFSRPVLSVDEDEGLDFLRAGNFKLVAATPAASALYWSEPYTGSTAFILGTEHAGLGDTWLRAATARVAIPMHGLADSLNVSVAGALLIYEALRQRSQG